ncbi:zinc-ribbon domain-containing protein [Streptococcus equi subsp. zooepidemicus]|nr:zinc-ribbon domain-containing protein [Streptococcus equi subsp. zooepidemicus]
MLAKYWSSKNELEPGNITLDPLENKRYLWECVSCYMDFKSTFREVLEAYVEIGIAGLSDICPYCTGKLPNPQTESLNIVKPFLIEEWHKNISNTKPIEEFFPESEIKLWWKCRNCHGQFLARICDREENDDCCPYCSGKKILKGFNTFDVKYPHLMKEWDYLNNILLLDPSEISESNANNVWWICRNNREHRYKMSVQQRILFNKRSKEPCLICKGRRRKRGHFIPYKQI